MLDFLFLLYSATFHFICNHFHLFKHCSFIFFLFFLIFAQKGILNEVIIKKRLWLHTHPKGVIKMKVIEKEIKWDLLWRGENFKIFIKLKVFVENLRIHRRNKHARYHIDNILCFNVDTVVFLVLHMLHKMRYQIKGFRFLLIIWILVNLTL